MTAVLTGRLQTKGQVDAIRQDYRAQLDRERESFQAQVQSQADQAKRREDQLTAQSDAWKSAYFSETQVSRFSRQQLSELFELAKLTEGTMRRAIEAQPPERSS